jgi:hypothetical protein
MLQKHCLDRSKITTREGWDAVVKPLFKHSAEERTKIPSEKMIVFGDFLLVVVFCPPFP